MKTDNLLLIGAVVAGAYYLYNKDKNKLTYDNSKPFIAEEGKNVGDWSEDNYSPHIPNNASVKVSDKKPKNQPTGRSNLSPAPTLKTDSRGTTIVSTPTKIKYYNPPKEIKGIPGVNFSPLKSSNSQIIKNVLTNFGKIKTGGLFK